jgi:hypothetical protein
MGGVHWWVDGEGVRIQKGNTRLTKDTMQMGLQDGKGIE